MLVQQIQDHFGIKMEKNFSYQKNNAFQSGRDTYILAPAAHLDSGQLNELHQLVHFMRAKGDPSIAEFVATKNGSYLAKINNEHVVLLKHAFHSYRKSVNVAKELALFHKTGRNFPQRLTRVNRIGQWMSLWEKRLDQMELFWKEKVEQHPSNGFEKLFIQSFPYYLGLTENAIQYLVDTELDERPQSVDSATICHSRFFQSVWRDGVKNPTDWLFDHCSRDLAEWIRHEYFNQKDVNLTNIHTLLENYERVTPLSPFSWRLLYSRLLFPVHFYECIEDHYIHAGQHEDNSLERLGKIVDESKDYEQFLARINDLLHTRYTARKGIPKIHWLKKVY